MTNRVCAAIIRDNSILMVQHREDAHRYWTLPGGAVDDGESAEEAAVREVREETGLRAQIIRLLFEEPFGTGLCRCYLMAVDKSATSKTGYDPEEEHLPPAKRMLQDVAWHPLESKKTDSQVSKVIQFL